MSRKYPKLQHNRSTNNRKSSSKTTHRLKSLSHQNRSKKSSKSLKKCPSLNLCPKPKPLSRPPPQPPFPSNPNPTPLRRKPPPPQKKPLKRHPKKKKSWLNCSFCWRISWRKSRLSPVRIRSLRPNISICLRRIRLLRKRERWAWSWWRRWLKV